MTDADLVARVLEACRALKNNEALFLPNETVIARSNTGRLWIGSHWGQWSRGDALEQLREQLGWMLDPRLSGYFASTWRRHLCEPLRPVQVAGVGRSAFYAVRGRAA